MILGAESILYAVYIPFLYVWVYARMCINVESPKPSQHTHTYFKR